MSSCTLHRKVRGSSSYLGPAVITVGLHLGVYISSGAKQSGAVSSCENVAGRGGAIRRDLSN